MSNITVDGIKLANGDIAKLSPPVASASTLGGVKAGSGLSVASDGTLSVSGKENTGKITIGGTEYSVTRRALEIVDGSTTTTYYVADIT